MRRFVGSCCLAVLASLISPPSALAQATGIAGVVKDTSGAVLPGVTVEAASPALIERTRSATTDSQGQYKILDLRPGTYAVTFTLPGFSTVKREDIELPAQFTATVNVELKVGTIEETVIVNAASPVVDVQNVIKRQVISSDVIASMPTSKNWSTIGVMTIGVYSNQTDVGGSAREHQNQLKAHGASLLGLRAGADEYVLRIGPIDVRVYARLVAAGDRDAAQPQRRHPPHVADHAEEQDLRLREHLAARDEPLDARQHRAARRLESAEPAEEQLRDDAVHVDADVEDALRSGRGRDERNVDARTGPGFVDVARLPGHGTEYRRQL